MKSFSVFLLIVLFTLAACTAGQQHFPPPLTVVAGEDGGCAAVYPQGRWQFVHAIDFSLANGSGATVIGVTSLAGDEIACALMTVEGLTLFEAVYRQQGGLAVQRAVPPFDKPAFAQGLMEDVRTIFCKPSSATVQYGQSVGNVSVCRYTGIDGRITDILPTKDGCWEIRTYGTDHTLSRVVAGSLCQKNGDSLIPEHLELKGFGQAAYTLKMTLVQAENMNGKTLP